MSEMDYAEAEKALGDAIEADAAAQDAPYTPPAAPAEQAVPAPAPGESSPADEAVTPVAPEASTVEWSLDPEQLPAEVQPLARELLGTFTQKTQALAEQRRQLEESLLPSEEQQLATELYRKLQDPNSWEGLHSELTEALKARGWSPAEASAEATAQLQEAAAPPVSAAHPDLDALVASDPELAPLVDVLKSQRAEQEALRQELASRDAEAAQRAADEQAQREYQAIVGETLRQDQMIRDMRTPDGKPVYTQDDLDEMYEISSFHNGNLLQARERFEAMRSRWAENYFRSKATVAAPDPVSGASALAQPSVEEPVSFDEAEKRAREELRGLGIDLNAPL